MTETTIEATSETTIEATIEIQNSKSLIVIDDRKLRKAAFAQAEKLIKRLERIEADLKSFETEDQQLYSSWYELTFRIERNRISELHAEYRQLTQFHNWMVAEAKRQDISIAQAFMFLRAEDEVARNGSTEDRALVEADRAARNRYIEDEIEKEYQKEQARQDKANAKARKAQAEVEQKFEAVRKASDEDLAKICANRTRAMDLLGMMLTAAATREHLQLLLRVWDLTPDKIQDEFRRLMLHGHGIDFDEMLESIEETVGHHPHSRRRKTANSQASIEGDRRGDPSSGDSRQDSDAGTDEEFDRDFIGGGGAHRFRHSAEDNELVKILYRKLVRRLHPDLQSGGEAPSPWHKAIWMRVQAANSQKDLRELERIYRMVLIRGRELSEITMAEILESQKWLEEELAEIGLQVKKNKNAPAWGFSRRKDYSSLKRKVEKTIMMELLDISDEVDELKAEHEYLEMLARAERSTSHFSEERGARRPRRRTQGPRRPGRRSGHR